MHFKTHFRTLVKLPGSFLFLLLFFFHSAFADPGTLLKAGMKRKELLRATVLLNNQSQSVPLRDLSARTIACVNAGAAFPAEFSNMLRNYAAINSFDLSTLNQNALQSCNTLVVQVSAQSLALPAILSFIEQAAKNNKEVIIAGSGDVKALRFLENFNGPVIWNQEPSLTGIEHMAQVIFGGEPAEGRLTDSISPKYSSGAGYFTAKTRLSYTVPEEAGISSLKLSRIDDIVEEAIREHATPGAVVMVVKNGQVIFNKAYGAHTYDRDAPTRVNDIYDLASVTKVAATTIAAMKLYDKHQLDLEAGIGTYLPEARETNKSTIPVRDVLLHQAGFINLDFFSYFKPQDHSSDSSSLFSIKLADNYFLRNDYYQAVMLPRMLRTPLPTRGQYVYSDISMFMMKEIIEHQAGESLDRFVSDEFYKSLGMYTAGFKPLTHFGKDQIVPTERDTYFRKTLLQGYVHDSGAALAGGVSGHAGLFASANDLAILNQMLLNGGTYGGVEYLKPATVEMFTARQSDVSRRGLGFDRGNGTGYPSSLASPGTYGHTGYTGTCVWVDPKEKLVYIFLSNRVYPSATNKLNSMRIRPRIQDVIYEAIADGYRNIARVGD